MEATLNHNASWPDTKEMSGNDSTLGNPQQVSSFSSGSCIHKFGQIFAEYSNQLKYESLPEIGDLSKTCYAFPDL